VKRALITTTVTVPDNLEAWRRHMKDDDIIIVAGDLKTPHDAVVKTLANLPGDNVYLDPDDQIKWLCSEVIGWNSIQRRNVALLEALSRGAEIITTVDTDNFPVGADWFDEVDRRLAPEKAMITTVTTRRDDEPGWYDPGVLCQPPVSHRGMPIGRVHEPWSATSWIDDWPKIGVVASLWKGDPDVGAHYRMANDPWVTSVIGEATLDARTWAPFNSQATTYLREVAPVMAVWPHVGRYDDIWASYLARATFMITGHQVYYGAPLVHQDRHPHDLVTDLEREIFGLRFTGMLTRELYRAVGEMPASIPHDVTRIARYLTLRLETLDWLPRNLLRFFSAWSRDLRRVM
jgi:hypothetical protein